MRVLAIGGAGYVGGLILPPLSRRHDVRVFDLRPPAGPYPYVIGDATDFRALRAAMTRVDAVLHCAMGGLDANDPGAVTSAFAVNVTSVYLALMAAARAGVPHAVHISSMSVFADLTERHLDESVPPDATDLYGLTKRLGEQACRAAAERWGLSVNVLRLAWPTTDRAWPKWARTRPPRRLRTAAGAAVNGLAATDLAAAVLAAFDVRDGFQVFTVTGDELAGRWSTAKARRVLGWAPAAGGGSAAGTNGPGGGSG